MRPFKWSKSFSESTKENTCGLRRTKCPLLLNLLFFTCFLENVEILTVCAMWRRYMQDFCINGMVLLVDITLSALHDITNTNLMHTAPVLPARCHLAAGLLVAPPAKPGLNDILLGNSTRRTWTGRCIILTAFCCPLTGSGCGSNRNFWRIGTQASPVEVRARAFGSWHGCSSC